MADPRRLIALGVFGAPQGVKGELRVKSYAQKPADIAAYGPLTDARGERRFALSIVRPLKDDMLVGRLAGVATREAAAELTGVELFARRDQLPAPVEDEFYYDDLVGLSAVTREGVVIGRVVAVTSYGAGDILEIAGADGATMLLPFSKAIVPEIDFTGERLVVEPPAEIEGEAAPGEA